MEFKQLIFRQFVPLTFAFTSALFLLGCAATNAPGTTEKIEGVSIEGPSVPSDESLMTDIIQIGAGAICLMPYGYMRAGESEVRHDQVEWQWWGEREEGVRIMCQEAKANELSVMIKPHLWIGRGEFTGSLSFKEASEQKNWNRSYGNYILKYARLAEELDAELFCIGTELCSQVADDQLFWSSLISDIRSVYRGQITYAANWDCYSDFPFWSELDYIGVDAYFPITDTESEGDIDVVKAWDRWKPGLKALSDSVDRPILFTEYGYRSCVGGLEKPWIGDQELEADQSTQFRGYQGLYASVWNEPWFAGGFLWKWHCKGHLEGDRSADYTPQNKPTLELIESVYKGQSLKKVE
ncbi:MAG: glycoside hydrolase [Flavobacteriales bacterium]|nr:glycoside hydrolase [Flavobacteriales bacterium]